MECSLGSKLERLIQSAASEIALAPKMLYQHPQGDYQLCEYIAGQTLQGLETASQLQGQPLQQLCNQLHDLHSISLATFSDRLSPYRYSSFIERYWQALVERDANDKYTRGERAQEHRHMLDCTLAYEQKHGAQRVVCHHDLNPANIVTTPHGCKLLDWEFAGAGIASMDFACLATELNIDIKEMSKLSALPENELDCAQAIYQYTCELYNLATACINS